MSRLDPFCSRNDLILTRARSHRFIVGTTWHIYLFLVLKVFKITEGVRNVMLFVSPRSHKKEHQFIYPNTDRLN